MQTATPPTPGTLSSPRALPSPGTLANWEKKAPAAWIQYPPLSEIARPTVDTATAAHYLNRRPQTLRGWSCLDNGPIRPIRINSRLAWSVADLRRVLGA